MDRRRPALPRNVSNLVLQNSYILILAIGMMLVIIAGHIDLSVGSVAAFVGAIGRRRRCIQHDVPWPLALVLGLVVGALVGAWQGFWVAYVGIPSFIVTLAGMLLFRGLDLMILGGPDVARSRGLPEDRQRLPARGRPGHQLPQPHAAAGLRC